MKFSFFRLSRTLYDWVLSLAEKPYGVFALFAVAFAESSFFPIPPDLLLIPMGIGKPKRVLWLAAVTTIGSVSGGLFGYLLGRSFLETIGQPIIAFYGIQGKYDAVQALYDNWSGIAVAVAGFTPIPYKVFTIAAGAFQVDLFTFVVASTLSRGARFFLIALLVYIFGPRVEKIIDRYFNLFTLLAVILLIGGFLVLRYVMR